MKITKINCIEFSLLLTGCLCVLTWYTNDLIWIKIAVAVSLTGLLLPIALRPFAWVWFKIGKKISYYSSTALLTIIFFLVVYPVALLRKLFYRQRKDLLSPDAETYFQTREHTYTKHDLIRQF